MGMDVWHSVTLEGVPFSEKKLAKLPDWNLIDSDGGWDFIDEYTSPTEQVTAAHYVVSGTGRYDDTCAMEAWAQKYTRKHPDTTVTIYQEWYEQEQGESLDVYRAGELVREESKVSRLTPIDLHEMLDAGTAAVARYDAAVEGESGDAEIDAAVQMKEILLDLVKGLS